MNQTIILYSVIFGFFWNTTDAIVSNDNKKRRYLRYDIIWGIVFSDYFNKKLLCLVIFTFRTGSM